MLLIVCAEKGRSQQVKSNEAMLNLTPLKVNGSKKAMAFWTMTKVDPQIRATSNNVISANNVVYSQ